MTSAASFDVIVVGGGHAGTEAALAAARMGARTLLLTQSIETLGQMSCNPAIGGIGKGHLVKEIDALGGIMARAADAAAIQARTLNASKGPAVRATRVQADRQLYKAFVRHALENQANLTLFQQECGDLIVEDARVCGVVTVTGIEFRARAVVLTVGTFLGGRIHVGMDNYAGGRAGDPPSNKLAERLRALPFRTGRLKTGTPPRIDGRTIDYSQLTRQDSDEPRPVFSYLGRSADHPRQLPCHITATTERTHDIIRAATDRSPLFTGKIEGVGPRYCPSVEDKVVRFADKASHQIFVEPEGLNTHEVYPNGISTSLPYDVQVEFVRTIRGFEQAHITRPGYAIEYDFFDPRDLACSLETRALPRLFFAGQINGTTGYEEAAAQGLIAGINAARAASELAPFIPKRSDSYVGVLIDDLVTRGTREPYRMFTSRAEHRLLLREDNADLRLTSAGRELGLVDDERWAFFEAKRAGSNAERQRFETTRIKASGIPAEWQARVLGDSSMRDAVSAFDLLRRPEVEYEHVIELIGAAPDTGDERLAAQIRVQLEVAAKYAGYIERQEEEIQRQRRNEETRLPTGLDYAQVAGLSSEVRQKLAQAQPATVGQAARVPGVTPAAVSILLVHLKKIQPRRLMASSFTRRRLLLAASLAAALGACGRRDATEVSAGGARVLLRGNGPDPDSVDPHRARSMEAMVVLRDLFEGLTRLDRSAAPAPGAAASWTLSDDGRIYTFKLRPNLRWSNGDALVAGDYVAGMRRLVDPATASQYAQLVDVIVNAAGIVAGTQPPSSLGVSAPDDSTVVITLVDPAPYLLGLLAHPACSPLHAPSLAKLGDRFARAGEQVSNGAFVLTEWLQGSYLRAVRNPNYWDNAANRLDAVKYVQIPDENAELRAYRAGELHATAVVPRGQFDWIRENLAAELRVAPQMSTYYFGFNLRKPMFQDLRVRRALSMAIDRERLANAVLRVGELPANGWVPPGTFDYSSQSFDYAAVPMETRIAEARRLLAEAGYSPGKPLSFELRYNNGEVHSKLAVAVSSMWKEALGAEVRLAGVEFKSLMQDVDRGDVDVFRLSWVGDYNDPYTFLQYLKSDFGINLPRYSNPAYDRLLNEASQQVDPAQRRQRLEAAERLALADHPLLPLYFYVNKHLVKREVRGWYDNVMNVLYSRDLELVPTGSQGGV